MAEPRRKPLDIGEAAPWFLGATLGGSSSFGFHFVGGRAVLMLFFGSAEHPDCAAALAKVQASTSLFDDKRAAFFGVTVDPADSARQRILARLKGIHFFLDHDHRISRLYGAETEERPSHYHAHWLVLDRAMRVTGAFLLRDGDAALAALAKAAAAPDGNLAPVVAVPNVFEPDLCRRLIALHGEQGGRATGFMREVDGVSKEVLDKELKVRRDHIIDDPALIEQLTLRLKLRLLPMVERAFQFRATLAERALIGCYEAETGGHFQAHRDNSGPSTAHRRFAVTINLNAEDYEGGDLVFPEFGARAYRAPTGGAIVFSCGLLHRVIPMIKGRRYAYLPFLYDDAAAKIRDENRRLRQAGQG